MSSWLDRLRFLWEEEISPPGEAPRADREEPAGVPRVLRRATHFALAGALGTTLMAQVIGIRLVAPVDAQPAYISQCVKACNVAQKTCLQNATTPSQRQACNQAHDNCLTQAQQECINP
jgi:hypothetical protein